MPLTPKLAVRLCTLFVVATLCQWLDGASLGASELRRSAIVRAIAKAQPAVVNIHGHKVVRSGKDYADGRPRQPREVNGMGTGVFIDPRGYIVTNFHVVQGVRQINVTLSDGEAHVARIVSHDPNTDLAIIKIPTNRKMPMIPIGRSHDLMIGEEVIAIGNAYGYEHTHTRGIISALHRTVKVTDNQYYRDLIQTDASINPGNSGGPLLNIDGQMIGINVAVRVGAQGIGFAIPADRAMQIAARLLSAERIGGVWHGIVTDDKLVTDEGVLAQSIQPGSPAARAGLHRGDRIVRVNALDVARTLDVERAMIGLRPGTQVELQVVRGRAGRKLQLKLGTAGQVRQASVEQGTEDRAWTEFGFRLEPIAPGELVSAESKFKGGMRVDAVRAGGPAEREGVKPGDVLVGIHDWVTTSRRDLEFIMASDVVAEQSRVRFYIVRNGDTLYGHLPVTRR